MSCGKTMHPDHLPRKIKLALHCFADLLGHLEFGVLHPFARRESGVERLHSNRTENKSKDMTKARVSKLLSRTVYNKSFRIAVAYCTYMYRRLHFHICIYASPPRLPGLRILAAWHTTQDNTPVPPRTSFQPPFLDDDDDEKIASKRRAMPLESRA